MNKSFFSLTGVLLLSALSTLDINADITVKLPRGNNLKEIEVAHFPISKVLSAKNSSDLWIEDGKVPVINNEALIKTDSSNNCRYIFGAQEQFIDNVFTSPGDNILVEIASFSPYYSVASGSELMDCITSLNQELEGLKKEINDIRISGIQPSKEKLDSILSEEKKVYVEFIEENPTSPLSAYAIYNLEDEDFLNYFSKMSEGSKTSILYPMLQARAIQIDRERARDKKKEDLKSGKMSAPNFSLENTYGKFVTLSNFKGKWVILDFWGSWCIWCIKGFPELKDAYQKYAGRLEVIGIDCRESKEAWLAGIKKYELPWVNLYCPDDNPLPQEYGVQGFPTKVIIDPEGKIRNITMGHDPDFYTKLDSLLQNE